MGAVLVVLMVALTHTTPATAVHVTFPTVVLSPSAPLPGAVDWASIGAAVSPSVVRVEIPGSSLTDTSSSGSGVVLGDGTMVVTNAHVVADVTSSDIIFVSTDEGMRMRATLVAADPSVDIAVLHLPITLPALEVAPRSAIAPGSPVASVGYPMALAGQPTLTSGIVSATGRSLETEDATPLYGLLQTDVGLAPGSSGGALVDSAGRLVGITTAIGPSDLADPLSPSANYLGFAIPAAFATRVANDLSDDGTLSRGFLGVRVESWEVSDVGDVITPAGSRVVSVFADSPADDAGVAKDDIIMSVNGTQTPTVSAFLAEMAYYSPGDVVVLQVLSGSSVKDVSVTLTSRLSWLKST